MFLSTTGFGGRDLFTAGSFYDRVTSLQGFLFTAGVDGPALFTVVSLYYRVFLLLQGLTAEASLLKGHFT